MKVKELRGLSMPDLQKKLKDSRQELFNLRFQMATGQLANHRQIRHVRRNLAQILTEIWMKEHNGEPSQTAVDQLSVTAGEHGQKTRQRSRRATTEAKS
jgi:large subunit ribosomal protein L29